MSTGPARPALTVGIGGPSCSGKTSVARLLAGRLGAERCSLLCLDDYYRDLSHLTPEARARTNFDAPEAIEHSRVVRDVFSLRAGRCVVSPLYDFVRHTRAESTVTVCPAPVLIVEGTLALHWSDLRALFDLKVYIDADAEECLDRRIRRDVVERGRSELSAREQWHSTVWPMHVLYVLPTRRYADIALPNSGHEEAGRRLAEVIERRLSDSEGDRSRRAEHGSTTGRGG